jgi:hypothetical protein
MCAAAKGFRLNALLRRACLGVIADLARVPVQDHLPPAGSFRPIPTCMSTLILGRHLQ